MRKILLVIIALMAFPYLSFAQGSDTQNVGVTVSPIVVCEPAGKTWCDGKELKECRTGGWETVKICNYGCKQVVTEYGFYDVCRTEDDPTPVGWVAGDKPSPVYLAVQYGSYVLNFVLIGLVVYLYSKKKSRR